MTEEDNKYGSTPISSSRVIPLQGGRDGGPEPVAHRAENALFSCYERARRLAMDLPDPLITISPDFLSGEPIFAGTRVMVQTLFEYIDSKLLLAARAPTRQ